MQINDRKLLNAARAGNVAKIRELIADGANVNILENAIDVPVMNIGFRPLEYAIFSKNPQAVKLLLENGAQIKYPTPETHPEAFENQTDEGIKRLLITKTTKINFSLPYACEMGNLEIVKLLIDHGADVNSTDSGYTPLHQAVNAYQNYSNNDSKQSWEIILYLLEKGANVNAQSGRYPILEQATWKDKNEFQLLRLLLKHDIDLNTPFEKGGTIFDLFKEDKYQDVKFLINTHLKSKGLPGLDKPTDESPTKMRLSLNDQLIMATGIGNQKAIISLLDQGADPCAESKIDFPSLLISKGDTAGEVAIMHNDRSNLGLLCAAPIPDDDIRRLANMTLEYNRVNLLKFLMDRYADYFSAETRNGLLKTACENYSLHNTPLVEFLLERGAMIDLQETDSALFHAVDNQRPFLTQLLLNSGHIINFDPVEFESLIGLAAKISNVAAPELEIILEDYYRQQASPVLN